MIKKFFTLLMAFLPFLSVFGQNPGLVTGNSDVINLSNYPNSPLLIQSGSEDFYYIGGSYLGTVVNHPMLSDLNSEVSNLFFIKYDKDGNPQSSTYITGSYITPRAFSFDGGLTVVGSASTDINANGNTLPVNGADRIEFIVKYNNLSQFDRMISIWDLEASQYPYSTSMMDSRTGTLFLAGTASQAFNLKNHGIIGKDMEDYFYVLSYDRNLALTSVFTAGMELGGEYGYYKNLEIIPDGTGSVIITGGWEGDRSPFIDGETLTSISDSEGVFAVKLDKDLKKEWVLQGSLNGFDYEGRSAITKGIALKNGDLVMVGATSTGHFSLGDVKIDFSDGVNFSNMFVFRISSEGNVQWVRPIQNMMDAFYKKKGTNSEEFTTTFDRDVIKWKEDVLYLCGEFSGGEFDVAGRLMENSLGSGAFVAALDMETGAEQWGYSLSSNFMDLNGFDSDGTGNVTLMGRSGVEQQFEGLETLTGESEMVFHLGLDFMGKPLWVNNAYPDPPGSSIKGSDLEVLNNGEIFSALYKTMADPLVIGGATIVTKDPYSTILVKLNANTELGGTIFDKSGVIVYPGIVKAYKSTSKGAYPIVQTVDIDDSGKYLFKGLYPGNYSLLAIPDLSTYPDGMPTYTGGAISWAGAQFIDILADTRASFLDITLSEVPRLTASDGSGRMSGSVSYGVDVVAKSTMALPAKKTAVILKRKASSKGTVEDDVVAYLETDEDGNYVFEYVPDGEYNMLVDVPGLPMNGNYDVEIISNTIVSELDFIIGDDEINIPGAVGVEPVELDGLMIYPNPGSGILHLLLHDHGDYLVQVYNTVGKLVNQRDFFSAAGVVDLDLSELETGMYLIKIDSEEFSSTVKYIRK